jgi:hypothetical protein
MRRGPNPAASAVQLFPTAGGATSGGLTASPPPGIPVVESPPAVPAIETLSDNAQILAEDLAAAASSPHRLVYDTAPLGVPLRFSGTVVVQERLAFDHPAANVTALLVDRSPDGSVAVVTRGWTDPQNRHRADQTQPILPGQWLSLDVEMQPDDYVCRRGTGSASCCCPATMTTHCDRRRVSAPTSTLGTPGWCCRWSAGPLRWPRRWAEVFGLKGLRPRRPLNDSL